MGLLASSRIACKIHITSCPQEIKKENNKRGLQERLRFLRPSSLEGRLLSFRFGFEEALGHELGDVVFVGGEVDGRDGGEEGGEEGEEVDQPGRHSVSRNATNKNYGLGDVVEGRWEGRGVFAAEGGGGVEEGIKCCGKAVAIYYVYVPRSYIIRVSCLVFLDILGSRNGRGDT